MIAVGVDTLKHQHVVVALEFAISAQQAPTPHNGNTQRSPRCRDTNSESRLRARDGSSCVG